MIAWLSVAYMFWQSHGFEVWMLSALLFGFIVALSTPNGLNDLLIVNLRKMCFSSARIIYVACEAICHDAS